MNLILLVTLVFIVFVIFRTPTPESSNDVIPSDCCAASGVMYFRCLPTEKEKGMGVMQHECPGCGRIYRQYLLHH